MKRLVAITSLFVALSSAAAEQHRSEPGNAGTRRSFSEVGIGGEAVHVVPAKAPATVVWFLGVECPMARLYAPRMAQLAREFASRNVQFVGVDSNRQDSVADLQKFLKAQALPFPVVRDEQNIIADRYGATRTPEVFLLDADLAVCYQGRIDDQYEPGVSRARPEREDLRSALAELLSGRPVEVPETTALGCYIGRVSGAGATPAVENDVTFTEHVIPVLQEHCIECHRSGEIGPFAMEEYDEVAGWAATMMETIDDGRMPPWGADPKYGSFANSRHMPESAKQILRDWIAGGLKRGDAASAPSPRKYVSGWQLPREPDLVLPMRKRPFHVPAEGTVEYQYFVVDPGFEEDSWVAGAQIIPGASSVVHHAIAFLRPPDGIPLQGIGWLTAYVPGQRLSALPKGHARKVPAGSKIVFQMHYTTSGTAQEDMTSIGLLFADPDAVTHEVITLIAIEQEFEIPPRVSAHQVRAEVAWLPEGSRLLSVAPHMHYRGKSFELYADRTAATETLLSVPRYDFNWQHSYEFSEPLDLDDIERLHFKATFDNSDGNPFNPDPSEWVTWGDQTWEEMAVAFFEVSQPRAPSSRTALSRTRRGADTERTRKIEDYVQQVFDRLDSDGDGEIKQSEVPIVVRSFSFGRFDRNGDQVATRKEVREYAELVH